MLSIKKFADAQDDNNVIGSTNNSNSNPEMELDYNFKSEKKPSPGKDYDNKDGFPFHPANLHSDIDNVIIPDEFQYGVPEVQRKGVKNTFYCSVCYVELSKSGDHEKSLQRCKASEKSSCFEER